MGQEKCEELQHVYVFGNDVVEEKLMIEKGDMCRSQLLRT